MWVVDRRGQRPAPPPPPNAPRNNKSPLWKSQKSEKLIDFNLKFGNLASLCLIASPNVWILATPLVVECWSWVGMNSDVWKSELSVFVSAKNANMDIRIHIHF
jgi:hypothetical protein